MTEKEARIILNFDTADDMGNDYNVSPFRSPEGDETGINQVRKKNALRAKAFERYGTNAPTHHPHDVYRNLC